ncbi:MAG: zinc-ribbon domain-containing protein [Alphaproteobacteria bacterium]|nr:zinc-ribbon domain-containing protein [Alphaproteobacteria bacterium]
MRIVCPACSAAYEVPDALLGSPRPVRCARCGHEWQPEPAAESGPAETHSTGALHEPPLGGSMVERLGELPESATGLAVSVVEPPTRAAPKPFAPATVQEQEPIPDPALAVSAEQAPIVEPTRRREATLLRLAWGASVLILVLLAWAAYGWRAEIMHAWPASERLYAALGLLPAGP